jgi:predicted nucleic acid-binding protein
VLVVDTSAVLDVLVGDPPDSRLVERLQADGDLHAPHLIDVEMVHALRRLVRRGTLEVGRAERARDDFLDLALVRYPHSDLVGRMWELRDNLTAYDAAFVALGEALAVPLVTVDTRLGAAPGHRAEVEVF